MLSNTTYQVFPITSETYVGTATAEDLLTERLVKALEGGTITFNYAVPIVVTVVAGMDFYVNDDGLCDDVTSTAAIMMS